MTTPSSSASASPDAGDKNKAVAIFAGGCFWCMQPPFDRQEGVLSVEAGYIGGKSKNPTYEEVCDGDSGHVEAARITFDPQKVPYKQLLDIFWRNIDPTQENGQFGDRGSQYRTVIFYVDEEQKKQAEASKQELGKSGKFDRSIATAIEPAAVFYPAEEYHQCYYKKNPAHYNAYKEGSGRAGFIRRLWGKE